jgi:vitamin B12 transporter
MMSQDASGNQRVRSSSFARHAVARYTGLVSRWCFLLALTAAASASAQSPPRDSVRLPEIVVTPTSVPTPRGAVAASVTVLRGADLVQRGVLTVGDALREVAGGSVVQGGSFGALTSLFLRGGQSDYTTVLVDGVPLNDPGGAIDLASLTSDNVDRIEIVRGPASVLYGSDAVSGVVQVFTRRGSGSPRVDAGIEGGSFDGLTPGTSLALKGPRRTVVSWEAGISGGSEATGYSLSILHLSTGGLYGTSVFDNSYENTAASALLRARPDAVSHASLVIRYNDHTFHYPTDGSGQLVDANAFDHHTSTTIGLDISRLLGSRVETRLMLGEHVTDGGTDDEPDGPADTVGFYASTTQATVERRRAEARVNVHGASGVLSIGGLIERESQRENDEYLSSFGNSTDRQDVKRFGAAWYAQVQATPTSAAAFNAGFRLDHSDTFGTFVTYRSGVVYRPAEGLRLRALAGTGFKEPTFYQNFATGFVRGNPALRPEHSLSWEVGAEQSIAGGRARLSVTYFSQRFRDLIDYTSTPSNLSDPNYFNVAGAQASGLELTATSQVSRRLDLRAAYTLLRTRVTGAGFDPGPGAALSLDSTLLRRPGHSGFASVRYRPVDRGALSLSMQQVGARADLDYTPYPPQRVRLPAYVTIGVAAEVAVFQAAGRTTTVTVRVDNVLDAAYEEVLHFPARGRTVWLGARAVF